MLRYCVLKASEHLIQPTNAFLRFLPIAFLSLTIIMLVTHSYKLQHWLLILIGSSVINTTHYPATFCMLLVGLGDLSFKSVQAGHVVELLPPKAKE